MRVPALNLAGRPFTNGRPVTRLALVLWLAGGALLAFNGVRYWQLVTGSEDRGHELEALEGQIEEHNQRIADLRRALDSYDLAAQNEQVTFLNQKIATRTFGWSELFDRLEEVLPSDVRLISLSPISQDARKQRRNPARQQAAPKEKFQLQLRGVAKTFDAELELLDGLFEHPSFSRPRLSRDTLNKVNQVEFEISVVYRPGAAQEPSDQSSPAADVVADTSSSVAVPAPAGDPGAATRRRDRGTPPAAVAAGGGGRPVTTAPPVAGLAGAGVAAATPAPTSGQTGAGEDGLPAGLTSADPRAQGDDEDDRGARNRRRDAQNRRSTATAQNGARAPAPSAVRPTPSTTPGRATSRPTGPAVVGGGAPAVATPKPGSGSGPAPTRPDPSRPIPLQPSASSALEPR